MNTTTVEVNINLGDVNGITPLHSASKAGNLKQAKSLLEFGGNVSARENSKDETVLHRATSRKMVNLLMHYGADPFTTDGNGRSSFQKYLRTNPLSAEAILDFAIGTNGQDEDSSELLLTFDLSVFDAMTKKTCR